MSEVHILAIDLAKRSFQICATAPGGAVLFNRTVSRATSGDGHQRPRSDCSYDHSYDRSQEHSLQPLRYPRSSPLLAKSGYQHRKAASRKVAFRTRLRPYAAVTRTFIIHLL
jgi:hypothetical protein